MYGQPLVWHDDIIRVQMSGSLDRDSHNLLTYLLTISSTYVSDFKLTPPWVVKPQFPTIGKHSVVLQVQLKYNDNKEWLKISRIIGRLVVDWVGVIMRLILIKNDFYLILMSVPLRRNIILAKASRLKVSKWPSTNPGYNI